LRTGVEQVSASTAYEYGSADRKPSGKFTEQPKLQRCERERERESMAGSSCEASF